MSGVPFSSNPDGTMTYTPRPDTEILVGVAFLIDYQDHRIFFCYEDNITRKCYLTAEGLRDWAKSAETDEAPLADEDIQFLAECLEYCTQAEYMQKEWILMGKPKNGLDMPTTEH